MTEGTPRESPFVTSISQAEQSTINQNIVHSVQNTLPHLTLLYAITQVQKKRIIKCSIHLYTFPYRSYWIRKRHINVK